jgi:hypothetical protein
VTLPIEDRLDGGDPPRPVTPTPTPTPYVVPAAPRTVPGWLWPLVAACAVAITGAVLWGVLMRPAPAPGPGPAPTFDARAAGMAAAKDFARTFADSGDVAEREIRDPSKPLGKIKTDHVARWKDARDAAFNARVEAALDRVIAPGNDSPSQDERNRYADLWHGIVAGVREVAK